ncbi:hypothetical protein D7Y06_20950 [Roseburia sp. 1XD42-69]|nr:hypothetical protein D7Y06_20950 [Roseburia sp. 1XD42-69]
MSRWITARKKDIKNPSKLQNRSGECLLSLFGYSKSAHQNTVFLYGGLVLPISNSNNDFFMF